jgi:hypothetical protein
MYERTEASDVIEMMTDMQKKLTQGTVEISLGHKKEHKKFSKKKYFQKTKHL